MLMKVTAIAAVTLAVLAQTDAQAQTAADSVAIRTTALNYIEGWYQGDAERMRSALHPDLAKRIMRSGPDGQSRLGHMTADQLINATSQGGGRNTPQAQQRADVRILDTFGNAAVVRVDALEWVDYLQLARTERGWIIVNVLWELR